MSSNFNPQKFLNILILQLRQIHVDLTPKHAPAPKIELMTGNPKECYSVVFYGYTPDYPNQGDEQPAYKVAGYAYPETKQFYLQMQADGSDWHDLLWPSCNGMTPAEKALRESGLVGYEMDEWEVIAE